MTPQKASQGLTESPIEKLKQSWIVTQICVMYIFLRALFWLSTFDVNAKVCFTFPLVEYYRCLSHWEGASLSITSGSTF